MVTCIVPSDTDMLPESDLPTPDNIYRLAFQVVHRFWGSGEGFDDVVQECVAAAYASMPDFDPLRGRWTTFLFHIMRGAITRFARQEKRHAGIELDSLAELLADTREADELMVSEELAEDVSRLLEWIDGGMGKVVPGLVESAKRIAASLIES